MIGKDGCLGAHETPNATEIPAILLVVIIYISIYKDTVHYIIRTSVMRYSGSRKIWLTRYTIFISSSFSLEE